MFLLGLWWYVDVLYTVLDYGMAWCTLMWDIEYASERLHPQVVENREECINCTATVVYKSVVCVYMLVG